MTDRARKGGRIAKTLRSLVIIGGLGAVLALWSSYTTKRDVAVATGNQSEEQHQFFIAAADRPDIASFFKKTLNHEGRLAMARNIGRYDDAILAKLCGLCLGDFDSDARRELTKSLTHIAYAHGDAVASQLGLVGSFQQLGVFRALQAAGPDVLPLVAKRLGDPGTRTNAEAFLVSQREAAVPVLLTLLDDPDKNTRLSAADALGKIGSKAAVPPLTLLVEKADGDEQAGYLSALAGIGDPTSRSLLTAALVDPKLSVPQRVQAVLGLGRIGDVQAAQVLWSHTNDEEAQLRSGALDALRLCPAAALAVPGQEPSLRLDVASGASGAEADAVVSAALDDPKFATKAARFAQNRPNLVAKLVQVLKSADASSQGDVLEAAIASLASTASGKASLATLAQDSRLSGMIQRQSLLRG